MPSLTGDDSFNDLLISIVEISRRTSTSDGMGGNTQVWASVGSVAARISSGSAPGTGGVGETFAGDKVLMTATHKIYLRADDTQPLATDKLVFGTRTFNVLGLKNPSEIDHHTTVLVEELV